MTAPRSALVAANIDLLEQGLDLFRRIDPALYCRTAGPFGRGSIGSHFRHCLDFAGSLLKGLPESRVDYCDRDRDERIARCPEAAAVRVRALVAGLESLEGHDPTTPLFVRAEDVGACPDRQLWSPSSLGRELQAVLSHTVHHYAIVTMLLRSVGVEPGEEFGVAPSTLVYWRSTG
jgi:hypothetical protein